MTHAGGIGLWDEQDQFYYDVLHLPDGRTIPLRVRSIVGLIPLFAVEGDRQERVPGVARVQRPHPVVPREPAGPGGVDLAVDGTR